MNAQLWFPWKSYNWLFIASVLESGDSRTWITMVMDMPKIVSAGRTPRLGTSVPTRDPQIHGFRGFYRGAPYE
jgi:hypothetical protein